MKELLVKFDHLSKVDREIARERLLHYHHENEGVFLRVMRKPDEDWTEREIEFMDIMQAIREKLELA